jgi:Glutaredoxin-like domain (DUF836)
MCRRIPCGPSPAPSSPNKVGGLTLLGRPGCGLCEDLLEELQRLSTSVPLPPLRVLDVDEDPVLSRRHGLDIPVLLLDGVVVCRHRLDRQELLRLLRPR